MSKTTETSLVSPNQVTLFDLLPSTSSSEELPARRSPSLDSAKDSPTLAVALRWSLSDWRKHFAQGGSSGKTSPASCHKTTDGRLAPSSGRWATSGMGSPTECWTRSMPEWTATLTPSHSDDAVCSLSDVLEETHLVLPRYFLSQRACEGILRRAERRGKETADAAGGFDVCGTLSDGAHHGGGLNGQDAYTGRILPVASTYAKTHNPMSDTDAEGWSPQDHSPTITYWPRDRSDVGTDVAVVQHFDVYNHKMTGDVAGVVREQHGTNMNAVLQPAVVQAVAIDTYNGAIDGDVTHSIRTAGGSGQEGKPHVLHGMSVRRLTPTECERLQGFPDGWTAIPWKGKSASECPDGPRYKALGNSMAVNCMRWIGARIQAVEEA